MIWSRKATVVVIALLALYSIAATVSVGIMYWMWRTTAECNGMHYIATRNSDYPDQFYDAVQYQYRDAAFMYIELVRARDRAQQKADAAQNGDDRRKWNEARDLSESCLSSFTPERLRVVPVITRRSSYKE